jgi:hypothetical protein
LVDIHFEERRIYAGAVAADAGNFPVLLDLVLQECTLRQPGVRLDDPTIVGSDWEDPQWAHFRRSFTVDITLMHGAERAAQLLRGLGGGGLEAVDAMDFTGVLDMQQHGSAVQFELPSSLAPLYASDWSWVLCLRAHVDAGPTDDPASWKWSQPELIPGWDSTAEVFLVLEPSVSHSCRTGLIPSGGTSCAEGVSSSSVGLDGIGGGGSGGGSNAGSDNIALRHLSVVFVARDLEDDGSFAEEQAPGSMDGGGDGASAHEPDGTRAPDIARTGATCHR